MTDINWRTYIEKGLDFHAFFEELVQLTKGYKNGTATHRYAHYYPVNLQRMKRGIKQAEPEKDLKQLISTIHAPITWIILTEQWCGDGAQTLPLFYKLANLNDNIQLVFLNRDENLDLMDQFLTDGGRAIPKLIQLNEDFEVTATWGPRPGPAQELVRSYRERNESYATALHAWYAADRYSTLQKEALELLKSHTYRASKA